MNIHDMAWRDHNECGLVEYGRHFGDMYELTYETDGEGHWRVSDVENDFDGVFRYEWTAEWEDYVPAVGDDVEDVTLYAGPPQDHRLKDIIFGGRPATFCILIVEYSPEPGDYDFEDYCDGYDFEYRREDHWALVEFGTDE